MGYVNMSVKVCDMCDEPLSEIEWANFCPRCEDKIHEILKGLNTKKIKEMLSKIEDEKTVEYFEEMEQDIKDDVENIKERNEYINELYVDEMFSQLSMNDLYDYIKEKGYK